MAVLHSERLVNKCMEMGEKSNQFSFRTFHVFPFDLDVGLDPGALIGSLGSGRPGEQLALSERGYGL